MPFLPFFSRRPTTGGGGNGSGATSGGGGGGGGSARNGLYLAKRFGNVPLVTSGSGGSARAPIVAFGDYCGDVGIAKRFGTSGGAPIVVAPSGLCGPDGRLIDGEVYLAKRFGNINGVPVVVPICNQCGGEPTSGGSGGSGTSGSGSGGFTRPCGCSGCECCPGICWWRTNWPNLWTPTSGKYAGVGSTWIMTQYDMVLNSPFDEYYWGGDLGIGAGCQLGMAGSIRDSCIPVDVLIMSGTVAWSDGITTQSFDIRFKSNIQVQFDCPNPDGYVFAIYFGLECDDITFFPFLNSIQLTADYLVAQDSGTDEIGIDTSTCSFTITSPTNIGLPAMTIEGVA